MSDKLFSAFALVAIASGVISLIRIALGHDVVEVVIPNMAIGAVCLCCMMVVYYKKRRKIERRT